MPRARSWRERLDAGEDIAAVAAALSIDAGTRHRGGRLGEMRRGRWLGPSRMRSSPAPRGACSGPVQSEFGWHVAVVMAVIPAGVEPFEAVRSEIEADLLSDARGRTFEAWLESRRQALTSVEPGWEHPGDPRLPDFFHRHRTGGDPMTTATTTEHAATDPEDPAGTPRRAGERNGAAASGARGSR